MKEYAVTSIGDLFVELQQTADNQYTTLLSGNPAAVACIAAKYGLNSALIGQVGSDYFGQCWLSLLQQYNVDTSFLHMSPNSQTNISFIHQPPHEPALLEYRQHPSVYLTKDTLPLSLLANTRILHLSGSSLIQKDSSDAIWEAIHIAREHGALISFSVDYNPAMWPNATLAKQQLLQGIKEAELAILTQAELNFLGVAPMDLLHNYSSHCILISMGEFGCRYVTRDLEGYVQGLGTEQTIDCTGYWDIFSGSFLYRYLNQSTALKDLSQLELEQIIRFSNEKAILSTTKKGALLSIPEK